jgi:hypothetical protein
MVWSQYKAIYDLMLCLHFISLSITIRKINLRGKYFTHVGNDTFLCALLSDKVVLKELCYLSCLFLWNKEYWQKEWNYWKMSIWGKNEISLVYSLCYFWTLLWVSVILNKFCTSKMLGEFNKCYDPFPRKSAEIHTMFSTISYGSWNLTLSPQIQKQSLDYRKKLSLSNNIFF